MTNREAGLVRACIDCGAHGAWLCRTTKGVNPGRALRLCRGCAANWWEYCPVEREPLPIEMPDEARERTS